eukprot:scaffold2980_cov348-Pavlova_lutheri.AAC.1
MQWGIGTPPNDDGLENDERYPDMLSHTIPTTATELTQTASTWPTRIWFRFYNDASDRSVFLEDVKIDGKTVDCKTTGIWTEELEDAEERWGSAPHPFGMYWNRNYVLAIRTEEPDGFPWLWIGIGAAAVVLILMLMLLL